ncbi:glycoside hydrolase family protein [Brucella sp. BO3]|nr:glycoside hydrolase family protein [Brucella sp. BO3]
MVKNLLLVETPSSTDVFADETDAMNLLHRVIALPTEMLSSSLILGVLVERLVKVPLTDNQFAALVSFDFNTGALDKSTLLKKLNKGDYAAVPVELMKWVNAGGKKINGLVNRRAAEAGLWAKGDFVSSNYVPATTAANKTDVATIGGAGAAGAVATIGPVIPEVTKAITDQQDELSSGQWVRVAIAAIIIGLTLWGVYRKIKS